MSQSTPTLSPLKTFVGFLFVLAAPLSWLLGLHQSVEQAMRPDILFDRGWVFNLLWLVPGLLLLLGQWRQLRRKRLERFVALKLLKDILPSDSPERRRARLALYGIAWFFLCLALTGPRWGTQVRILQRRGIDIVVAVDVSESMLAKDIATTSGLRKQRRLQLARQKVKVLMELLKGERIGMIAFSGQPFRLCPLTVDYNTCGIWLNSFDPSLIPYGGTALAGTIRKAIPMFDTSGYNARVLLLITDGDDQSKDTIKAAKLAKKKGIRIYTLGIGSTRTITLNASDIPGNKDDQRPITTRLNAKLLQQISALTGGQFKSAEVTQRDIRGLFAHATSTLDKFKRTHKSKRVVLREARFPIFLTVALLFFLLEAGFRERKTQ